MKYSISTAWNSALMSRPLTGSLQVRLIPLSCTSNGVRGAHRCSNSDIHFRTFPCGNTATASRVSVTVIYFVGNQSSVFTPRSSELCSFHFFCLFACSHSASHSVHQECCFYHMCNSLHSNCIRRKILTNYLVKKTVAWCVCVCDGKPAVKYRVFMFGVE